MILANNFILGDTDYLQRSFKFDIVAIFHIFWQIKEADNEIDQHKAIFDNSDFP